MLSVLGEGEASAHILLPLGEFAGNAERLSKALKAAQEEWNRSGESHGPVSEAEFFHVAGQSDLLLRLRLNDFRLVSDVQSRLLDSSAQSTTWIFSIPYASPPVEPESATLQPNHAAHFVVYLRVCRSVYMEYGQVAEKLIVDRLQSIVSRWPALAASVHYTLGWADLVLHGSFDCSVAEFIGFLIAVQDLRVAAGQDGGKGCIFQKTLTVIGLPLRFANAGKKQVQGPDVVPLMFARAAPGFFQEAKEALVEFFPQAGEGDSDSDIRAIDGKWDLLLSAPRPLKFVDFFALLRESKGRFKASGIERTQTHLLFNDPAVTLQELSAPGDETDPLHSELDLPNLGAPCDCFESISYISDLSKLAKAGDYLPASLKATVSNCLSLFHAALRDSTNCCDSRPALIGCLRGLEGILRRASETQKQIPKAENDSGKVKWHRVLENFQDQIEEWCNVSRRVIRERVAGSFENLFSQSYSMASHRGGIQKILYIADNLVRDFYSRIEDGLKKTDVSGDNLRFSTIYEPRSTISSSRFIGVIKIPLRYAFSLHLVLPQLWHEAAQDIFQQNYFFPDSRRLNRNLKILEEEIERETKQQPEKKWLPLDGGEAAQDLSDMFADLLVLRYGFRENYINFMKYLTTLILEAMRYRQMPPGLQVRYFVYLFRRLYFAAQFLMLMDIVYKEENGALEESVFLGKIDLKLKEIEDQNGDIVRSILSLVKKEVLGHPHYVEGNFDLPGGLVPAVCSVVGSLVYDKFFVKSMKELLVTLWRLRAPAVERRDKMDLDDFRQGRVVDIADRSAIGDYYLALYMDEVDALLATSTPIKPKFQEMAALGRSAILAFYKNERQWVE